MRLVWVPMEPPDLDNPFANLPDLETRRGAITVWKPPGEVSCGPLAMAGIYAVLPAADKLAGCPVTQALAATCYSQGLRLYCRESS